MTAPFYGRNFYFNNSSFILPKLTVSKLKNNMETHNKRFSWKPLLGSYRRGSSGSDAGHHRMRTVGGEELSRRALAGNEPKVLDWTSRASSNNPTLSMNSTDPSYRNSLIILLNKRKKEINKYKRRSMSATLHLYKA